MRLIFAFDHEHEVGNVCSFDTCEFIRKKPTLFGNLVVEDLPMTVVGVATKEEYLGQPVPDGWVVPPPMFGCDHYYVVELS